MGKTGAVLVFQSRLKNIMNLSLENAVLIGLEGFVRVKWGSSFSLKNKTCSKYSWMDANSWGQDFAKLYLINNRQIKREHISDYLRFHELYPVLLSILWLYLYF